MRLHLAATLLLISAAIIASSFHPKPSPFSNETKQHNFCGVSFGVDNQAATTCTVTVVRLSPTISGTVISYNVSYANGQSGLFALHPLNLQSTITIKGNITGTWSSISAVRVSDGFVYTTYTNTGGTTYALFGIPNYCEDIYLVVN